MSPILGWGSKIYRCAVLLAIAAMVVHCGTKNQAEPYEEKTNEEKAKQALDAREYDDAITLYEELIVAEPERYDLVTLLSSAYAGRAGIDIVSLLKNSISGSSDNDVLGQVATFVPTEPNDAQLRDTSAAIARLRAIPLAERDPSSTKPAAISANLQLVLYATASAAMTLNQVAAKIPDTGSFDPEKLQNMSDAQVDAILNSLATAAEAGTLGTGQAAGQGAQDILNKVAEQPGATNKEKLINYLQTQNH